MQLHNLNPGTDTVRHLLKTESATYSGVPSCVINIIGQAKKTVPNFIEVIFVEVVLFHPKDGEVYEIEVSAPLQVEPVAEAHRIGMFNPSEARALIEGEVLDVAINLQRKAIEEMIEYDLLSEDGLEKFNAWNGISPESLLLESFECVTEYNGLHSPHFMASKVKQKVTNYLKRDLF